MYLHRNLISCLAAVLLLVGLSGCMKKIIEDIRPADPAVPPMPEATQTGRHTFGCFVDGKEWVARRQNKTVFMCMGCPPPDTLEATIWPYPDNQAAANDFLIRIHAPLTDDYRGIYQQISFSVLLDSLLPGTYGLVNRHPSEVYFTDLENTCVTNSEPLPDSVGTITFTRIDTAAQILSGTFNFDYPAFGTCRAVTATQGRFDLRLRRD